MSASEIPITTENKLASRQQLLVKLAEVRLQCAQLLNIAPVGTPDRSLASDLIEITRVYLDALGACMLCCIRLRCAGQAVCEGCAS